jgi:transcriptional regulator
VDKTHLELVRGTLDVLILKALIWGPLHGYAITNLILRQTDRALLVDEGTLYPALWRLEGKGHVESEWGLSENNRKAKFYGLTTAGKRHLREQVKAWSAYSTAVDKMLGATKPPVPEEA